ncbi:cysteine--tRNA ligase [Thalassobaculum salexigens]|uniref:cysteine--tRNA ligase n=1 Tax=Thalassobaculum salexigens TaxID=455360 RepID=UPI0003F753B8|nr:cysteine--tRNA ligase [Thalassobaculum salexigens]
MDLKITNTLLREKQVFTPIDPSNVRVYVCGPTVYDYAHVGNARPAVVFDVLIRVLRHLYGAEHVTHVANITDIDDKIMTRAKERGVAIEALTHETTEIYNADMAAIGVNRPDMQPRATGHVGQMIALAERLIERGHAYAADGHVLFNVPSMTDYGQLSRRDRDEMIAGARVDVAPYKRDPADFVLWKPSADDQPGWDSPWGRGRPGWHIECSAMAAEHLGEVFDIHGGGLDLIFPHHENEIAQTRCAFGHATMANYWMHNGFVTVEGEKMSKSVGNFYTVHDMLQEWPGEAVRLLLLSAHYRQPLDFSKAGLKEAKTQLDKLYGALHRAANDGHYPDWNLDRNDNPVLAALCDDLNTPLAIGALHQVARELNIALDHHRSRQIPELMGKLLVWGELLGLLQGDTDAWFKGEAGDDVEEIEALIAARIEARKDKNFAEADRIRDDLKARGIELEDGAGGTTWKRAG